MSKAGLIKKVAVIGGGPAGLVAVQDSLKQKEYGWEVIGFEAKDKLGGVWSDEPGSRLDSPDVFSCLRKLPEDVPEGVSAEAIFNYGSPLVKDGQVRDIKALLGTSCESPLKLAKSSTVRDGIIFSNKTGIYDGFFSNVPGELMVLESEKSEAGKSKSPEIAPLVNLDQIHQNVNEFVKKYDLERSFRTSTSVEYLDKLSPDKWFVIAKRSLPGSAHDEWYLETFDAVIIANGHFSVPYVPFYMSKPSEEDSGIHRFNRKFPEIMTHVRDLDIWYHRTLPHIISGKSAGKRKVVIVGKSFSCMDVLKRLVPLKEKLDDLEIIVSTHAPPMPENIANPFYWFDQWLSKTTKVTLKGPIKSFLSDSKPAISFTDNTQIEEVSAIIFATGYLYSFPFMSEKLSESYRIFVTEDSRNYDHSPSHISRVTGLYLHTLSIADPTLGFVGISSNANFQSFSISSELLMGVWTSFNKLFIKDSPKDGPIYNSIWSQVLPSVKDQLEWTQNRFKKTGNLASYHFYYPLPSLKDEWLNFCKPLFTEEDNKQELFPPDAPKLSQEGIDVLHRKFLAAMSPE